MPSPAAERMNYRPAKLTIQSLKPETRAGFSRVWAFFHGFCKFGGHEAEDCADRFDVLCVTILIEQQLRQQLVDGYSPFQSTRAVRRSLWEGGPLWQEPAGRQGTGCPPSLHVPRGEEFRWHRPAPHAPPSSPAAHFSPLSPHGEQTVAGLRGVKVEPSEKRLHVLME